MIKIQWHTEKKVIVKPSDRLGSKKRILLVDDEIDNSSIFKIALEDNGFHIDVYNDPDAALSAFKSNYYHLLLLDIRMPKIDGYELC